MNVSELQINKHYKMGELWVVFQDHKILLL